MKIKNIAITLALFLATSIYGATLTETNFMVFTQTVSIPNGVDTNDAVNKGQADDTYLNFANSTNRLFSWTLTIPGMTNGTYNYASITCPYQLTLTNIGMRGDANWVLDVYTQVNTMAQSANSGLIYTGAIFTLSQIYTNYGLTRIIPANSILGVRWTNGAATNAESVLKGTY